MNHYDNPEFFAAYAQMARSLYGLEGAGEWHQLKPLFPDVRGRSVLDLGCGYGWHCRYAAEQGAAEVLGVDRSERMIREALRRNPGENITYRVCDLLNFDYPEDRFDAVVSNLVLHYVEDLDDVYRRIRNTLRPGGVFLMNIEHPTFTAGVHQQWLTDGKKNLCWPVDNYYYPGERATDFLGFEIRKYHHTLTQILGGLLKAGFLLEAVEEAMPPENMMHLPGMADEMRRPMMLLVRARKA